MPGEYHLIGEGWLQFTSDGALETATTPPACPDFSGGATAAQCFELSFGPDITNNGGTGLNGTTQFASALYVYVQDVNGHVAGTGSDVHVDGYGEVTVEYDSGASLMIGTLALARFATEAGLALEADGSFSATNASGPPQMGYPTAPGAAAWSNGALAFKGSADASAAPHSVDAARPSARSTSAYTSARRMEPPSPVSSNTASTPRCAVDSH